MNTVINKVQIEGNFSLLKILLIVMIAIGASYPKLGITAFAPKYVVNTRIHELEPIFSSPLSFLLEKKPILLTFDDGPSNPGIDRALLAILEKHSAKSIWFVNCRHLDPALTTQFNLNRETLTEIKSEGNLIENHGYNHLNLVKLDSINPELMRSEINACSNYIETLTGARPKYLRPPWGQYNSDIKDYAKSQDMKLMLWTLGSQDWLSKDATKMDSIRDYMRNIVPKNGDVIVFHDRAITVSFLDEFLTRLDRLGYIYVVPN
ncbi:MAG TPA: polysaccharide deacetylase family protein [Methylophilaceae bacterium]|jgi:peptidoglycan/xylan/chitin deacetylase (PgdA/CDA1 family)